MSLKESRVMVKNNLKQEKTHPRKVRIPPNKKKMINNRKTTRHHLTILRKIPNKRR